MEETRNLDECGMEEFGRLFVECIDEIISKLGDRWWPQTEKQKEDRISKQNLRSMCKMRNDRPTVGGVAISSENGANFYKVCVANGSSD